MKNNALYLDSTENAKNTPTNNQNHGLLRYKPSKVAHKADVQNNNKGASGVEIKPKPIMGIVMLNNRTDKTTFLFPLTKNAILPTNKLTKKKLSTGKNLTPRVVEPKINFPK